MARVFNKLASELTADLNQAIREIETLKREVHSLKGNRAFPNRTGRRSTGPKKASNRTPTHTSTSASPHVGPTSSNTSHHPSHHESSKEDKDSSYVFPQEPFNPPSPPEAPSPGNN